ncbi:MAG TPA: bifunctional phosphoglucose/phosphomannose isomerase [bacterium]|nr:bifunctional phosphoglucose/phosphomannose isomerase [bacterium]
MIDLSLDSSDMLGKIREMPRHLRAGLQLGQQAWHSLAAPRPEALVVAGMGASALCGDLLRSYLAGDADIPVVVFRDYGLPRFVGEQMMVVVSSYSGNTEEAVSALEDAVARKAFVVCITSGGRLLEEARRRSLPYVQIPGGLPPRASLGYSFSALLALACRLGLCPDPADEIASCAEHLEGLNQTYRDLDPARNPALQLGCDLRGRVPILYCGGGLEAVALRWKNQFCENSKQLAFASVLPEANHNEVMGWEGGVEGLAAGIVLLRAAGEHPSVARSLSILKRLAGADGRICGEFWASGSSLLCRQFSLILIGDYASAYLALARGIDPTPIRTIDRIKAWLKEDQGTTDESHNPSCR